MKTTTLVSLLIVSLQAQASSIGSELLTRTHFASSDILKSTDVPYLLEATSTFQLELPVTLTGAHFCAVSDSPACDITSLMVMLGTVRSTDSVEATTVSRKSIEANEAVASRVPLPGTLGMFGIALLAIAVIRRRQSAGQDN